MPFERKESDSVSSLVKLQGKPLDYVKSLQNQWESANNGKELHKGVAVAMILNAIPKDAVMKAISDIIIGRGKSNKSRT